VESIAVNHEEDTEQLNTPANQLERILLKKFQALGYPKATEENGLLLKLKSYASCMVGRIKK